MFPGAVGEGERQGQGSGVEVGVCVGACSSSSWVKPPSELCQARLYPVSIQAQVWSQVLKPRRGAEPGMALSES